MMATKITYSSVKTPPEPFNQKTLNLFYIRRIREMINGDPSLAHAAFRRLKKDQKRLLLIASGLSPQQDNWQQLNKNQIRQLQKGIKRLKLIVNAFSSCDDVDFQIDLQAQKNLHRQNAKKRAEIAEQAKYCDEHIATHYQNSHGGMP